MAEQQPSVISTEDSAQAHGKPHGLLLRDARLRKHADYQRVYGASRKHFSASMSYFYAVRSPAESATGNRTPAGVVTQVRGPRVGLTAGRVLGKAVDRNRIKRRMREVVRRNLAVLTSDVDLILHPRKFVVTLEFSKLDAEVERVFTNVQAALDGKRVKP
ncbi:MAG TPA: ribonuclease P protein component [Acidisarcina sp.]